MQEKPVPRRDSDEVHPTDPRFAEVEEPNDEQLVVAAEYTTVPRAVADYSEDSAEASPVQRVMDGAVRAGDRLLSWVQQDPAVALGAALGLGLVLGFVLRRSAFLSPWEVQEVKRV